MGILEKTVWRRISITLRVNALSIRGNVKNILVPRPEVEKGLLTSSPWPLCEAFVKLDSPGNQSSSHVGAAESHSRVSGESVPDRG